MSAFRPRGAQARWNSEGTVMVYTSEHPALAALEILNGWEIYTNFYGYYLYRCTFDDALILEAPSGLDVQDKIVTRAYGDTWVRERRSVILKVSSVVVSESYNYLINPNHPDFLPTVRLEHLGPFMFDKRIEKLVQDANEGFW